MSCAWNFCDITYSFQYIIIHSSHGLLWKHQPRLSLTIFYISRKGQILRWNEFANLLRQRKPIRCFNAEQEIPDSLQEHRHHISTLVRHSGAISRQLTIGDRLHVSLCWFKIFLQISLCSLLITSWYSWFYRIDFKDSKKIQKQP